MATADVEAPSVPGGRLTRLAAISAAIDRARETNRGFATAPISLFKAARDLAPLEPAEPIASVAVGPDASRIGDAVEELLIGAPSRYSAIAIARLRRKRRLRSAFGQRLRSTPLRAAPLRSRPRNSASR
jgi:hypothetical protein